MVKPITWVWLICDFMVAAFVRITHFLRYISEFTAIYYLRIINLKHNTFLLLVYYAPMQKLELKNDLWDYSAWVAKTLSVVFHYAQYQMEGYRWQFLFALNITFKQHQISTFKQHHILTLKQRHISTLKQRQISTLKQRQISMLKQRQVSTLFQRHISTMKQIHISSLKQRRISTLIRFNKIGCLFNIEVRRCFNLFFLAGL